MRKGKGGPSTPKFRVMSDQVGSRPNTDDLRPADPGSGYGYLKTRDGTKLAINTYLPGPAEAGPYPTLIEYSGYGYADPSGGESSIQQILSPARVRGRRRQHARHRLLGRRLRLLRAAAGPRRLRRDRDRRPPAVGAEQQGRDGRRLLRRDQPAVRRPDAAAEPRGDRPAVADRPDPDDALSGRRPQHRLRPAVGDGPRRRLAARRPRQRPGLGLRADPGGRRDLQGKPAAAPRGGQPAGEDRAQPVLQAEGRRPAVAGHLRRTRSTCRCSWPASGPTSRRAATARPSPRAFTGTDHKWFTFTNGVHTDSLDPGDLQPLVRLHDALRRAAKTAS